MERARDDDDDDDDEGHDDDDDDNNDDDDDNVSYLTHSAHSVKIFLLICEGGRAPLTRFTSHVYW